MDVLGTGKKAENSSTFSQALALVFREWSMKDGLMLISELKRDVCVTKWRTRTSCKPGRFCSTSYVRWCVGPSTEEEIPATNSEHQSFGAFGSASPLIQAITVVFVIKDTAFKVISLAFKRWEALSLGNILKMKALSLSLSMRSGWKDLSLIPNWSAFYFGWDLFSCSSQPNRSTLTLIWNSICVETVVELNQCSK